MVPFNMKACWAIELFLAQHVTCPVAVNTQIYLSTAGNYTATGSSNGTAKGSPIKGTLSRARINPCAKDRLLRFLFRLPFLRHAPVEGQVYKLLSEFLLDPSMGLCRLFVLQFPGAGVPFCAPGQT